jgi:hypothetical protein
MTSRKELGSLFERFERLAFPDDSVDEEVSDLYAELAEYDAYVAGLCVTLLEGGNVPLERLKFDEDLKGRIRAVVRTGREPAATDAARYLSYLDALEQLLGAARSESSPSEGPRG